MDKREEEILDDILGGEETEEYEEIIIPESLRGEPKEETEEENKDEKSEETELDSGEPDLSEFLDENTEIDDNSDDNSIDAELDKALSKFVDSDSDKSNKKEKKDREKIEKEISEKIEQEKKQKSKLIKNISIICVAVLIVAAGTLLLFLQLDPSNNFSLFDMFGGNNKDIITVGNNKVSLEQLKLTMILNEFYGQDGNYNPDPKQTAVDDLTFYMVVDKAAKDRKIELTEEDKENLKQIKDNIKNDLEMYNIILPNVSDEEFDFVICYMALNSIYSQLVDILAIEKNYTVDESLLLIEFEDYKLNYKTDYIDADFKYILTDSQEMAEEARNALTSGESPIEDIVRKYFLGYPEDEAEIPMIQLNQMGFLTVDEIDYILSLQISDISEIFYVEPYYVIFIPDYIDIPTDADLKEWFRDYYAYQNKNQLFYTEYDLWMNETTIKYNEKAIEDFDENAYFESLSGE